MTSAYRVRSHPIFIWKLFSFFSCGTNTVDAKTALKEENNLAHREIFRRVVKIDKDVVASENGELQFVRFFFCTILEVDVSAVVMTYEWSTFMH